MQCIMVPMFCLKGKINLLTYPELRPRVTEPACIVQHRFAGKVNMTVVSVHYHLQNHILLF